MAVLERMMAGAQYTAKTSLFEGTRTPDLGLLAYIQRIVRYVKCSGESIVVSLVYIDRLTENGSLVLSMRNAHRVLITCVLVAVKLCDDFYFSNAVFAKVGGVSVTELKVFLPLTR